MRDFNFISFYLNTTHYMLYFYFQNDYINNIIV